VISIIKLRLLRLKDDIGVVVLMTVMALALTAVFGTSLNEYHPTVLIVDEDRSSYSQILMDELRTNDEFDFLDSDIDTAVTKVEEGNAIVAIVIKEGFQGEIETGESISLGIIKIKDDTIIITLQEIVKNIATKMAGSIKVAGITADFIESQSPNSDMRTIKKNSYDNVMESWKYKTPINIISTVSNATNSNSYDDTKHSMIGFTVFFSMFTMVFGIGTIINDRQNKTWQRMLISPISKSSILGGTMVVAYLVGALQMGMLILGGKYLFGIDWGNSLLGVIMVTAAFIFSITSFGLLISGVAKTEAQLGSITPLLLTSTSMLGGCMWPLEIVDNKILLMLAELTPQKWAIQGIENIASKGMGFESAILPTIVLLLMGIIFFGAGVKITKFE